MPFVLPDLPYAKNALEPYMSVETLDLHHGKHHRTYVEKTNELVAEKGNAGTSLVDVIRAAHSKGDTSLFNQAAQVWNHSFFWQCLAPPAGNKPVGQLAEMVDKSFGSTDFMLEKLKDEAVEHFSNGYAWLVLDRGRLDVISLHDADTPVVHEGLKPLLAIDLWEHAYYLDYRNVRPDFLDAVLGNVINWEFVAQNLDGDGARRADQDLTERLLEDVSS